MNWLKNFVRPKLRKLVGRGKDSPDNLWHNCQNCQQRVFHRDLEKNLSVCPHCGFHLRVNARQRMTALFDNGQFQIVGLAPTMVDPLKFRDSRRYSDRLKEAKEQTGDADALTVASGGMGGIGVVMAVLDFQFMGGSMGLAVGEGLLTAARLAVQRKSPLIVISSSGGARMQEGVYSLMQMARTTIAVEELREAGLPYIMVLADPTTGGVTASFAMLGDVAIAEPGAIIGFAGQRVIEQTIRETLPEGFQRAEYLYDHGMVDMVVHRAELRATLIRVLSLLMQKGPSKPTRPILDADGNVPALGYKGNPGGM
ncbi:MAG: acetyl-CoA carboxylase subunit beta [Rhodospirillales bacterium RIFCSPLOWO2_01_FULL_65_14]|nr:MAG: acetyl-CoA carboxylase subunit beta [Rhodospirillales bacterium RIFCSPLOWO2_01_FULL_65_14]